MNKVKEELLRFTRAEKLFVFFSILTGFSVACEYGITRPAGNAIFLSVFSSDWLPWVWIATVPLNLAVIFLYNYFLPKVGPLKMLYSVAASAIGINLFCAFFLKFFPSFIFFHYAWKEVYVLLMFKQFWSMVHATVAPSRAKYLYGVIFGMGTLGSIVGSLIPGFFASVLGSEQLFLFTLPIYLFLIFSYTKAFQLSTLPNSLQQEEKPKGGFSLIRNNRFLVAVLLLVVLMQVSVGLMEYQFNAKLEFNILDKDLRTEYCGKLNGVTNILSTAFQWIGGFLMVHALGLRGSHFFIPLILLISALFCWIIPSFALFSFAYVLIKSIDYSLFGVVREMLYIPLQLDEKYRAKAIIDVFAYRTSKALVSLVVLVLQAIAGAALLPLLNLTAIAVFVAWILVVLLLLRKTMPAHGMI